MWQRAHLDTIEAAVKKRRQKSAKSGKFFTALAERSELAEALQGIGCSLCEQGRFNVGFRALRLFLFSCFVNVFKDIVMMFLSAFCLSPGVEYIVVRCT
jgi:hypothetical protein